MDEDAAIVQRCQKGDLDAFGELVEKYQKPVFNAALRIVGDYETAKDIMQTAFVKAFTKLNDFDLSRRFFSWIYRITINESINLAKRESRTVPVTAAGFLESNSDPEEHMMEEELRKDLMRALGELQAKYRSLIVLKYIVGLSYGEISETLKLPIPTVKSRLYAARLLLREAIMEKETT